MTERARRPVWIGIVSSIIISIQEAWRELNRSPSSQKEHKVASESAAAWRTSDSFQRLKNIFLKKFKRSILMFFRTTSDVRKNVYNCDFSSFKAREKHSEKSLKKKSTPTCHELVAGKLIREGGGFGWNCWELRRQRFRRPAGAVRDVCVPAGATIGASVPPHTAHLHSDD